jgi:hypothetical protein
MARPFESRPVRPQSPSRPSAFLRSPQAGQVRNALYPASPSKFYRGAGDEGMASGAPALHSLAGRDHHDPGRWRLRTEPEGSPDPFVRMLKMSSRPLSVSRYPLRELTWVMVPVLAKTRSFQLQEAGPEGASILAGAGHGVPVEAGVGGSPHVVQYANQGPGSHEVVGGEAGSVPVGDIQGVHSDLLDEEFLLDPEPLAPTPFLAQLRCPVSSPAARSSSSGWAPDGLHDLGHGRGREAGEAESPGAIR